MRTTLAALLLLLAAPALAAERLTVLELYTSQGCSSCPPADALLAELARTDPTVLPLGLHVTYWDRLGWKDPYSLPEATQRQREAGGHLSVGYIYTPQLVVDGRWQAVGSDPAAVRAAIAAARTTPGPVVPLTLQPEGASVRLHAGAGPGRGTLLLVGFDRAHTTEIRRGENAGRTLGDINVVRAIAPAASWSGAPVDLVVPRPPGDRTAALLQAADGRILAATLLP